jgi:hypothetical protein
VFDKSVFEMVGQCKSPHFWKMKTSQNRTYTKKHSLSEPEGQKPKEDGGPHVSLTCKKEGEKPPPPSCRDNLKTTRFQNAKRGNICGTFQC